MECEIKLEGPASPDVELGKEETEESKKRKRKPYRPGIGLNNFKSPTVFTYS
jgi:histone-lysine N-methyltransferase MLL2